ncbi:Reverse transcriptase domain-containing protein [Mycena indigotica]|uniref:Reverse transcriptase domain-containing protein n=1 Tax=Mycena indigotica TaxID=2126181 RepID=A0A8H6W769_9AGAR|nr:Reverse transcriptase domain-containing protein [Mycena indigotica]KAF7304188.1 Reverse transcriptase domain-containing protein [Mycena indigotica]
MYGPLDDDQLDLSVDPNRQVISLPTFSARRRISSQKHIVTRQQEALAFGAPFIKKDYLLDCQGTPRRLYEIFSGEFDMLSHLLSLVEWVPVLTNTPEEPESRAYRFYRPNYNILRQALDDIRQQAKILFDAQQIPLPPLPTWGDKYHWDCFYLENDFEILGVCFRAEVENFLVILEKNHLFEDNILDEVSMKGIEDFRRNAAFASRKKEARTTRRSRPRSQKGLVPCRHCGSGRRVNFAGASNEEIEAQSAYDDLYYSLEIDSDGAELGQGFDVPLQPTEPLIQQDSSDLLETGNNSALEGNTESRDSPDPNGTGLPEYSVRQVDCSTFAAKPALNRKTCRRLAREIRAHNYHVVHSPDDEGKTVIELRKHMARPPGSSFLGSSATETVTTVNSITTDPIRVIVDPGSDITLISRKALESLTTRLKIKTGHDIRLIQVTGKSSISGFVTLDLYFHTEEGPVKLNVDAYVVDGMTAPLILGNDFADQYSMSILGNDGITYLQFGNSGRRSRVESSTAPSMTDDEGHAFQVRPKFRVPHLHKSRALAFIDGTRS